MDTHDRVVDAMLPLPLATFHILQSLAEASGTGTRSFRKSRLGRTGVFG